jgi:hypothetical protein
MRGTYLDAFCGVASRCGLVFSSMLWKWEEGDFEVMQVVGFRESGLRLQGIKFVGP